MFDEKEKNRIRRISDLLYEASKSIRILSHISWPGEVRQQFFADGARELPIVSYPEYDPSRPIEIVEEARKLIG